ncbi:MAG: LacI family DNA-binding transcriptional regulator [Anaerolineales bacterium]|nr:LacI family DNA-binding transcriptional regulator [Anaerolineales bacterium]
MPLTLEDIAKVAGVSRSTVSRVINGDENVNAATRAKVDEVLKRLNFQPNIAARSLAAGRTGIVGLVIPAGVNTIFTDPYFPQLIQAVTTTCNANDYSVMLWLAEPTYERRTIRQILHGGLLDGVIVSSMLVDDPIVQALYDSHKPFVLIGRHPTLDVNYVDVDNVYGARQATQHLLQLGRRRVGTITGPRNMIAGIDRYQGYREALRCFNQSCSDELVVEGDFSEKSGYRGMQQLLLHRPDAVFVATDTMAMGAMRALRERNLRVPDDIAVVGYDDGPAATQLEPPLTTIRQFTTKLGVAAMENLMEIIRNPGSGSRHQVLQPELVIRVSCGSPIS